jgi:hypothetical protein
MVVEVNGRVDQIAQAANHETVAANAVSETIHQVASSAKESSRGAEQVVTATADLLSTAKILEDMVEKFALTDLPQDQPRETSFLPRRAARFDPNRVGARSRHAKIVRL